MAKIKQDNSKKAQIKIQETAFFLLALVFLFVIVLIFYSNIQVAKLYEEYNKLQEERAISMLSKLSEMPELSCLGRTKCIDYDKMEAMKELAKNGYAIWKGFDITIERVYPEKEVYDLYEGAKKGVSKTYSTFVSLCELKYDEENVYSYYDCDIARLHVSVTKK